MRKSSNDLTKFSRNYVVTENPEWEEKFHLVLDARSGDFFRKALRDSITDAGHTQPYYRPFGFGYVHFVANTLLAKYQHLNISIENEGISGNTVQDLEDLPTTWGGYDNFIYLFSYEDSRDSFNIGHDLKILKQVFKHDPGGYARQAGCDGAADPGAVVRRAAGESRFV